MSDQNNNEKPAEAKEPVIDSKMAQETFEKLLAGQQITEKLETSLGVFEIRFPVGPDFLEIDRRKALMRGGLAPASFDRAADANMEALASLDVVIVDAPAWWKKLEGAVNCPDVEFINELYRGYLRLVAEVRTILSFRRSGGPGPVSDIPNEGKTVDHGLFSGFAVRFGFRKPK